MDSNAYLRAWTRAAWKKFSGLPRDGEEYQSLITSALLSQGQTQCVGADGRFSCKGNDAVPLAALAVVPTAPSQRESKRIERSKKALGSELVKVMTAVAEQLPQAQAGSHWVRWYLY